MSRTLIPGEWTSSPYKSHDMIIGPCKCGVWHDETDEILISSMYHNPGISLILITTLFDRIDTLEERLREHSADSFRHNTSMT